MRPRYTALNRDVKHFACRDLGPHCTDLSIERAPKDLKPFAYRHFTNVLQICFQQAHSGCVRFVDRVSLCSREGVRNIGRCAGRERLSQYMPIVSQDASVTRGSPCTHVSAMVVRQGLESRHQWGRQYAHPPAHMCQQQSSETDSTFATFEGCTQIPMHTCASCSRQRQTVVWPHMDQTRTFACKHASATVAKYGQEPPRKVR